RHTAPEFPPDHVQKTLFVPPFPPFLSLCSLRMLLKCSAASTPYAIFMGEPRCMTSVKSTARAHFRGIIEVMSMAYSGEDDRWQQQMVTEQTGRNKSLMKSSQMCLRSSVRFTSVPRMSVKRPPSR